MNNLISIILPVYNAEKYIEKCLKSLITQTYNNIEILCINDGSKDNSYNILKKYAEKDNRIKVFTQENSGPAKTRNVGLDNASGDYIMFCDADDYYQQNMCELMLKTIIENDVDIVMCGINIIYCLSNNIREEEVEYFKLKLKGKHDILNNEILSINIMLWNKILKRSIINNNNIHFLDGFEHDDANFILKYLINCKNYYGLDLKLYNYQIINPNSVMMNFYYKNMNNKLDFIYSYNNLIDYVVKNNFSKNIRDSIIISSVGTFLAFAKYLNKKQINILIYEHKKFFKDITEFDDNWYVKTIKEKSLRACSSMYYPKLNILENIFSIKERNEYEIIITILGFRIIKRK
ncbi:glycosyltransferase [Brachyspira intermedia]|uniref:glycosyltransferase family 2 protein n=1 Tax=Brachyspira intermedia TaxID=84377 RepID=UPI0030044C76